MFNVSSYTEAGTSNLHRKTVMVGNLRLEVRGMRLIPQTLDIHL